MRGSATEGKRKRERDRDVRGRERVEDEERREKRTRRRERGRKEGLILAYTADIHLSLPQLAPLPLNKEKKYKGRGVNLLVCTLIFLCLRPSPSTQRRRGGERELL